MHERWQRLWLSLGSTPDEELWESLCSHYGQAHRSYHNMEHVRACLQQLDAAPPPSNPLEVELALWFHDAIYDPGSKKNELESAAWASAEILDHGLGQSLAERVYELIMLTRHDREELMGDDALIVDIDLAILGASPDDFAAYDQAIRHEYTYLSDDDYRSGRIAVLNHFLDHKRIYFTEYFYMGYERQARANLQQAIRLLRTQN